MDPIAEYGALFERAGPIVGGSSYGGSSYRATPLARGPWDPNALHGGPVAALFAHVIAAHEPDGLPPFVSRLTVELLRPVPLGALAVHTATLRPGRKVAWIDATMSDAEGTIVAAARALRTHRLDPPRDVGTAASPPVVMLETPRPETPFRLGAFGHPGFWTVTEFRLVAGSWDEPGPASAWLRLRVPVVAGAPVAPLERVCAAADFGSGLANPVRLSGSGAINPELSVHVHRDAQGEWIGLESIAWAHGDGAGLCESRLFDERGPVGRASQALLVHDQIPPAPPSTKQRQ